MSSEKKRKLLTLSEKIEILHCIDVGKMNVRCVQERFKIGKTQIYTIIKMKAELLEEWLKGSYTDVKRRTKKNKNQEINELLLEWLTQTKSQNIPLSGPILKAQAKYIAEMLGNTTFSASNGWLDKFKNRNKIVWNTAESKDREKSNAESWGDRTPAPEMRSSRAHFLQKLYSFDSLSGRAPESLVSLLIPTLIENYDSRNIYNGHVTGVFFRGIPPQAVALEKEKCRDGRYSKERLTVFLCANLEGKVEPPLVVGKATIQDLFISCLPVSWRSNNKAWVTKSIMEEWLVAFNDKMSSQERQVILFLDKITQHPELKLSHVKLIWLQTNTVSQPMNHGIIYHLKQQYRKLLMTSLLAHVNKSDNLYAASKEITTLDALHWLSAAVTRIPHKTVVKCFEDAGFNKLKGATSAEEDSLTGGAAEEEEAVNELAKVLHCSDSEADAYIKMDDDLSTYSTGVDSEEAEGEVQGELKSSIESYQQALETIRNLKLFAIQSSDTVLASHVYACQDVVETKLLTDKYYDMVREDEKFYKEGREDKTNANTSPDDNTPQQMSSSESVKQPETDKIKELEKAYQDVSDKFYLSTVEKEFYPLTDKDKYYPSCDRSKYYHASDKDKYYHSVTDKDRFYHSSMDKERFYPPSNDKDRPYPPSYDKDRFYHSMVDDGKYYMPVTDEHSKVISSTVNL